MDEVESAPSSALECAETLPLFFEMVKSAIKNNENAPAERPEALWTPVPGGNLEDLHGDANQELDSVLRGNLDDLECERAARREKGLLVLPPTAPPAAAREGGFASKCSRK